ncbi:MAG TPA: hypothetical protein VKY74_07240 [Chloroflexia bacterium]|nr:hypothetical protein [Chloroflexia bacterium]
MATPFSRSLRSLAGDSGRPALGGLLLVAGLLAAGAAWCFLARIALYEVSDTARVTAGGPHPAAVAEFAPTAALGHIRLGQPGRIRLAGFPWTQYGSLAATVTAVGGVDASGRVPVTLALHPDPGSPIPLQPDLTGSVEVEVAQVAPATLVLRAAGQGIAAPAGGEGPP